MDGVLVDAAESYIAATIETVTHYTPLLLGGDPPAVTRAWVYALKDVGGFNNDWDLSSALVRGIRAKGAQFDVNQYAAQLQARGGGPAAVDALWGPLSEDERQTLGAGDELKAFFQEYYLGEQLYQADYGRPRRHYFGDGFIEREQPIVSSDFLGQLALPLGIATGRPLMEAQYTLERFGTASLFSALVTHDCAVQAGQPGKPTPWVVLEAARRLDTPPQDCAYIGDQADDMRAATAAGCTAIGFNSSDNAAALRNAGAHQIVETESALLEALAG
jgi:HAD superfamily hydrolase (TIGR01548 family)